MLQFRAERVLLLSELSIKEKEKYYTLFIKDEVKFRPLSDGRYVGNMRILAPNVKKSAFSSPASSHTSPRKEDSNSYFMCFEERYQIMLHKGFGASRILFSKYSQRFNYFAYPRFASLIAFDGEIVNPKPRTITWLMKMIDDIYDHRFAVENQQHQNDDVNQDGNNNSDDVGTTSLTIFPIFALRRIGTTIGLKSLTDQLCWDMLYTLHCNREEYLEAEIFARFLQEFYDKMDLLFFLYVRSVLSDILKINFKTRWNSMSSSPIIQNADDEKSGKGKWMSYRHCVYVSRLIFGEDSDDLHFEFMDTLSPIMVGKKTVHSPGRTEKDTRRLNIDEFLHLSVLFYHRSVKGASNPEEEGAEVRVFPPVPGQSAPQEPIPRSPYEGIFDLNRIPSPPPASIVELRRKSSLGFFPSPQTPDDDMRLGGGVRKFPSPSKSAVSSSGQQRNVNGGYSPSGDLASPSTLNNRSGSSWKGGRYLQFEDIETLTGPSEDLEDLNSSGNNAVNSISYADPASSYLLDDRFHDDLSPPAVTTAVTAAEEEEEEEEGTPIEDSEAAAAVVVGTESDRLVPTPIASIIKVGRKNSIPQPVNRESDTAVPASRDSLESFDLVRMERSAQFLSCLFLPLSAAAAVANADDGVTARCTQMDEADKEVIRDRLTMLLGRKLLSLVNESEHNEITPADVEQCVTDILQRSDFIADMERRRDELIMLLVHDQNI